MRFRDDIITFARDLGHDAFWDGVAIRVRIPVRPHFTAEILIPTDIYEWWISVTDDTTAEVVFTDWTDHYGSPEHVLNKEHFEGVCGMIQVLTHAEARVAARGARFLGRTWFKHHVFEIRTETGWSDVWDLVFPSSASSSD